MTEHEFITIDVEGDRIVSRMPPDETVVEVRLSDGNVVMAWYACDIAERGDWDFIPVNADGEPDDDADSIAADVVAWRPKEPTNA